MKRFVKWMKQEEGFTLAELIASLTILGIVSGTIYAVITFGFNSYNKVTVENALRDEADLIMSSTMTELYTLGPTSIKQVTDGIELTRTEKDLEGHTITHNSQIMLKELSGKVGLFTGETGKPATIDADLSGSTITLDCSGKASECSSGLIEIDLHLAQNDNRGTVHRINLTSRFGF
ncbi:prepilin-type N-terminal cleavage/methylation domain-containing protein [Paenibacillus aestuarii]|uniref:Prepilin-type N-terminal cleavage/methylation domain-containing protein n=1 Tax=Paenibacillus aestuarii TaxID=516965 RepID=A0ABW0KHY6_9BACL|nr:prepilin-type N-terminal cleavage/methylation domain-containing protein [Paenibacillus aestuarii]